VKATLKEKAPVPDVKAAHGPGRRGPRAFPVCIRAVQQRPTIPQGRYPDAMPIQAGESS